LGDLNNWTEVSPLEDCPDRDTILWEAAVGLGYNKTDPRVHVAYEASVDVDIDEGVTGICNEFNLSALLIPTEYAPSWISAQGLHSRHCSF
jgi:amidase